MKRAADRGEQTGNKRKNPSSDPAMVRKLRHRFVRTAMISLFVILLLLVGIINVSNFIEIDQRAAGFLRILQDNGGTFPDLNPGDTDSDTQISPSVTHSKGQAEDNDQTVQENNSVPPPFPSFDEMHRLEAPYETRYFCVRLDSSGDITSMDTSHVAAISDEQARSYALSLYQEGKKEGYYGAYKYSIQEQENGTSLAVFVDCSSSLDSALTLLRNSLLLSVAALLLMLVLVFLLSGRAVAPVVESLDKQKRFVSDAGHELKTPIAIISANVDVLEMTGTKNKWTQSIRHQTGRMTDLVNNLLTLSRMEEGSFRQTFTRIDFSAMLQEACATYETVAQARNRKLTDSLQEGLYVQGEAKSLQQLCTLLLDNAVKYSPEGGTIEVLLRRDDSRRGHNTSRLVFEVVNSCDQFPDGDLERLFDRFYRADTARTHRKNTAGGFGIGLSVARAICINHGGSIDAVRDGANTIRFRVQLPIAK